MPTRQQKIQINKIKVEDATLILADKNVSVAEIAKIHGVTTERIQQRLRDARYRRDNPSEIHVLPSRAKAAIVQIAEMESSKPNKELVLKLHEEGRLKNLIEKIPSIGVGTVRELMEWAGIDFREPVKKSLVQFPIQCPHCHQEIREKPV